MHIVKSKWLLISGIGLLLSQPVLAKFYTIIGPDGFPMVVHEQQIADKKKLDKARPSVATARNADMQPTSKQSQAASQAKQVQPEQATQKPHQQTTLNQPAKFSQLNQQRDQTVKAQAMQAEIAQLEKKQAEAPSTKPTQIAPIAAITELPEAEQRAQAETPPPLSETQRRRISDLIPRTAKRDVGIQKQTEAAKNDTASQDPYYAVIDGEAFVSHEYLEDREYNLEGRKRFYVMPEVGDANAHRMQTIEREKGLTSSILGSKRKQSQQPAAPLVLAADYFRIGQQDVIDALEQRCFEGEKVNKAKVLSKSNQEIGFWPVDPLTERFVYEVAKLAAEVDVMLLQSYSSNIKNEQYYWPMLVFLDQQGCVLEGVSGFKNKHNPASAFRHASIEGLIKKPESAVYLFMTPLASAVDVDEALLSNHGQIKLTLLE